MKTRWETPPPRGGPGGVLDRFVGPGATRAELALQFGLAGLAAIAALVHGAVAVQSWSGLQYALCMLLAFDVAGGIVTNATSSGKRWYHRAGQGFWQHLGFVSVHLIHLAAVAGFYLEQDLRWFAIAALYLLAAAVVELTAPRYLQRPVAMSCYAGSLLIWIYLLRQPPGLEWFLPMFYLKLLVSHLPQEQPWCRDDPR